MKDFVFGEEDLISFKLKAMNSAARKRGVVVRGPVSGGNLVVLQSTMGTKGAWDTRGRILFFEDIGERGYRIDRVLEQFEQAGMFSRARAVIFGQFTGGAESDGRNLIPAVLKRFAEKAKLPVFGGLQSGHDVIQRPVPFETPSSISFSGSHALLACSSGSKKAK
jgi:muramoyltetrapeptide carboxypeptidase